MQFGILKELILYRYRYILAYVALIIICGGLTLWQLNSIPLGFSADEMNSAVAARHLKLNGSFVDGPYIALQKVTLALFEVGTLGIRLPSVIYAILMVMAAYILLKRWFKENIAIIGTLLIVTSTHFLLRGRTGSPAILYSLWPMLLLATGSLVIDRTKAWKFWLWCSFIIVGFMFYTPYLVYVALAAAVLLFVSPSGRQILFEAKFGIAATSIFSLLLVVLPLGWSIYNHPEIIKPLLGITEALPSLQAITERAITLANGFFDFLHPQLGLGMTPYLSLPALILSLYGLTRLCLKITEPRYTLVVSWFTLSILAIVIFNAPAALMFVPLMLLTIYGFYFFIRHWYELFPRNPYARMAALLPIAALLLVMMQFNFDRYFYGLARSNQVHELYDADIKIAKAQLQKLPPLQSGVIVVDAHKQAFFQLLTSSYPNLQILNPAEPLAEVPAYLVSAQTNTIATSVLQNRSMKLITDSRKSEEALRFKLYR
ncbi:MAG TPA: glycosyltransferase family 39 protein [Candidatus Saccharimonadales bacterium]